MKAEILDFHKKQTGEEKVVCDQLYKLTCKFLPEAEHKIWHRHPVWFLEGNPIVGYSKLKAGIRLMFWSGADFEEEKLRPGTGRFKDASITYTSVGQIIEEDLSCWLKKSREIQWDYKNIYKRKGQLVRVK